MRVRDCVFRFFRFFKLMGQSRHLFAYFRSFLTISIQIEKSIDGVLRDSNPGPQDGRRRRNHGACVFR